MENYESKAIITKIQATSRASVKIRDNYFTMEFSEERMIPDIEGVDLEQEKSALWDEVIGEVDAQVALLRDCAK